MLPLRMIMSYSSALLCPLSASASLFCRSAPWLSVQLHLELSLRSALLRTKCRRHRDGCNLFILLRLRHVLPKRHPALLACLACPRSVELYRLQRCCAQHVFAGAWPGWPTRHQAGAANAHGEHAQSDRNRNTNFDPSIRPAKRSIARSSEIDGGLAPTGRQSTGDRSAPQPRSPATQGLAVYPDETGR